MANVIVNLGNTPVNISGSSDLAQFAASRVDSRLRPARKL